MGMGLSQGLSSAPEAIEKPPERSPILTVLISNNKGKFRGVILPRNFDKRLEKTGGEKGQLNVT